MRRELDDVYVAFVFATESEQQMEYPLQCGHNGCGGGGGPGGGGDNRPFGERRTWVLNLKLNLN